MKSIIIFFYQYVTSDGVRGDYNHLCGKIRSMDNIQTITNYALRIMHYELSGRPQGIAPTDKYHQTYIVTIIQSALIMTRTSVRLYVVQCHISSDNPIRRIS